MPTTAPTPALDNAAIPGTYLTDGEQLYRVLGPPEPRHGFVAVEDCRTLEIYLVQAVELLAWDLTAVCHPAAAALG
jgi:hypothetical protein